MKRRKFLKKIGAAYAAAAVSPFILPSGRLFAATGSRLANHVVFVLFAGGIRNQESVDQLYLATQGLPTQGNVMENMLTGNAPSANRVYNRWAPVLQTPLSQQGTLFKEMRYSSGPTGHYNGHTVAMTGNYTVTGLNLFANPEYPTVFEYYRKHADPAQSAINAWWLSEGLGPYPALNYSSHEDYGPQYGANFLHPATIMFGAGTEKLTGASVFQPDDVNRMNNLKGFLDSSFDREAAGLASITNSAEDGERIKKFILDRVNRTVIPELPTPSGGFQELTGDLINISAAWQVLQEFKPELLVINTFNSDVCHTDFSSYLSNLHRADYGIGWLWNKIQSDPVLANDTIMICAPEHGRNLEPNSLTDINGLSAFDHTSDDNSRRLFSLIVGPPGVVQANQTLGSQSNSVGESIDLVPTIAEILGFKDDIPPGLLPGRVLNEAFV